MRRKLEPLYSINLGIIGYELTNIEYQQQIEPRQRFFFPRGFSYIYIDVPHSLRLNRCKNNNNNIFYRLLLYRSSTRETPLLRIPISTLYPSTFPSVQPYLWLSQAHRRCLACVLLALCLRSACLALQQALSRSYTSILLSLCLLLLLPLSSVYLEP